MFLRRNLFGIAGIILACGLLAFAQQPQTQTSTPQSDENFRKERIERRQRHREMIGAREGRQDGDGMGRRGDAVLRELNLTNEQRQQSRAIMERRLESTKVQREELMKLREKKLAGTFSAEDEARARALHQEIRAAMEGGRSEIAGILTAEQKAQLEVLKQQHKAEIEQRMKDRREFSNKTPR
jgi:Spy/CpxP family protein refolding chaperone